MEDCSQNCKHTHAGTDTAAQLHRQTCAHTRAHICHVVVAKGDCVHLKHQRPGETRGTVFFSFHSPQRVVAAVGVAGVLCKPRKDRKHRECVPAHTLSLSLFAQAFRRTAEKIYAKVQSGDIDVSKEVQSVSLHTHLRAHTQTHNTRTLSFCLSFELSLSWLGPHT